MIVVVVRVVGGHGRAGILCDGWEGDCVGGEHVLVVVLMAVGLGRVDGRVVLYEGVMRIV